MVRSKRCPAFTDLQQFWNLAEQIFYRPPLQGMKNVPGFRIDSTLWEALPSSLFPVAMALPSWTSVSFTQDLGWQRPQVTAAVGKRDPRTKNRLALGCRWHVSPAHNSLGRTRHMALPNWTECRKYWGASRILASATGPCRQIHHSFSSWKEGVNFT